MSEYESIPRPASPPAPPVPPRRSVLGPLLLVLLMLVAAVSLPHLVEQVQFAAARGRIRAEAEGAARILAEMPEPANRFRFIAKKLEPSVVGINTEQVIRGHSDEMSALFGFPREYRARGQGSGVIVDAAGYVITNYHVVRGATRIDVQLSDGRTIRDVELRGADTATDIALLKIDAGKLTAAEWGDSAQLEVGDPVLAIGNPFGLEQTVTAGILSAKGRRGIVRGVSYQDFLQTDVALNPGNSGGPLVDMNGRIVGINTAILGRTYQGISFSIPSHLARDVYEKLKATGDVPRGWLGVTMQELSPELARSLGLDRTDGALVSGVLDGAPAERASIEPGDVIVAWNGQPVADPAELALAVARTEVGSTVQVTVIRDGRERTFSVAVGRRPAQMR
jgi:serine protease Do